MERRKAITTAAAASLTLLAGAAGIALNSGIVGTDDDDVGQLSPVSTAANPPITVDVDDPLAPTASTPAPALRSTDAPPVTTSAASGYRDDKEDDHDDHDEDEDEDDEYEGAEDDD